MVKRLTEMTNEELWQLFPVILEEYNPEWPLYYEQEKERLLKYIRKNNITRISHIGSTAIPGLVSKPTIDILLEIYPESDLNAIIISMEKAGYIYSPQPEKPAPHMMFMKGYTTKGFEGQVFHVHIRYFGDWDELYFRDYLLSHPEIAKEYGVLKQQSKIKFEHDRDSYTDAKTDFIHQVVRSARTQIKVHHITFTNQAEYPVLANLWEASVRATHTFLTEKDIQTLRPQVENDYLPMVDLRVYRTSTGNIVGFLGIAENKIEMLFISPEYHGTGIGKVLLSYAIQEMHANKLDVNEQNPDALGFYLHMGFQITGRSELDGQGNAFPLLHLKR